VARRHALEARHRAAAQHPSSALMRAPPMAALRHARRRSAAAPTAAPPPSARSARARMACRPLQCHVPPCAAAFDRTPSGRGREQTRSAAVRRGAAHARPLRRRTRA
jgi:hypothetical protein